MNNQELALFIGNKIKSYRKSKGMTQKELAEKVEIGGTTIANYEKGFRTPKKNTLFRLAKVFDISIDDLFPSKQNTLEENNQDSRFTVITDIYRQLTPARKNNVYDYVVDQLDEQKMAKLDNISDIQKYYDSIKEETEIIKLYGEVSAGVGVYVDDQPIEEIRYPSPAPSHDIALRVTGNSMVPMFKDGEVIFVKKTPVVRHGQIGIFIVNGNGFVKKLYRIGDSVKLISINNDYDDIVLTEHDTVHVVGAVIL